MKARAIGATVEQSEGLSPRFEFSEEEVETLARMEHVRWFANSVLARYTYGPRDEEKRQKDLLVPWVELPEAERDYCRETVRRIPEHLHSVGQRLRRDAAATS